jgi:hypothetical protein
MSYIIATETLAKLYEKHGVFDKAKDVYEQLLQQQPDRTDFESKVSDLEIKIDQSSQQSSQDYRKTLDQGFANDQEGMPLDAALDEFDDNQQKKPDTQVDPAILDQIMVMTLFDEGVDLESGQMEIKMPVPDNNVSKTALPQIMHKWIDLLLMKRKIDQLKQLKQRAR